MKRTDKPTAQIENPSAEAGRAETAVLNNWAEAWTHQFGRSGEVYGRLFAGLRDEGAAFFQKRLDANLEAARALGGCRSVNEALELQQSWLRCAVEHYGEQSARMSDMCRSAFFPAEPETARQAPAEPAMTERKPAPEAMPPPIQRAAE